MEGNGSAKSGGFLKSIINSLVGLGFDSKRENLNVRVLLASTFFLSVASAYTTWNGLSYGLPPSLALFATFAIQALLFVLSWRIGAALVTGYSKFSQWFIYMLVLMFSVFFSYATLVVEFNSKERRKENNLQRSRSELAAHLEKLARNAMDMSKEEKADVADSIVQWRGLTQPAISSVALEIRESSETHKAKIRELELRAVDEKKHGGATRKKSSPGKGPIYWKIRKKIREAKSELIPALSREKAFKTAIERYDINVKKLSEHLSYSNMMDVTGACAEVLHLSEQGRHSAHLCKPPSELVNKGRLYVKDYREIKECDLFQYKSLEGLKNGASRCAANQGFIDSDVREDFLKHVATIGLRDSEKANRFEFAISQLGKFDMLAYISLVIALVIDTLILLCGIVGARPTSFLDMTKPRDVDELREFAIRTVMITLDEFEADGDQPEGSFQNIAVKILSALKTADERKKRASDCILYLDEEDPERLGIGIQLALYRSLGVVDWVRFANGDGFYGFHTRFVLWLCHQLLLEKETVHLGGNLFRVVERLKKWWHFRRGLKEEEVL